MCTWTSAWCGHVPELQVWRRVKLGIKQVSYWPSAFVVAHLGSKSHSSSHCLPWCAAAVFKECRKMLLGVGLPGNLIDVSNQQRLTSPAWFRAMNGQNPNCSSAAVWCKGAQILWIIAFSLVGQMYQMAKLQVMPGALKWSPVFMSIQFVSCMDTELCSPESARELRAVWRKWNCSVNSRQENYLNI